MTDESSRLARWLRLMGYDAALRPAQPLAGLYRTAYNEGRTIVTRNRRVKAGALIRVVQVVHTELTEQLRQLVQELGLSAESPERFSRCDRCNVLVEPVDKEQVKAHVPEYVYHTQEQFTRCPSCGRIYWAATHWQRACALFQRVGGEGCLS